MKPRSFQDLLREVREGNPLTVESGVEFWRTVFFENGSYWEETPGGKKKISLEEAQEYIRLMVARWRRERREQRKEKMTQ